MCVRWLILPLVLGLLMPLAASDKKAGSYPPSRVENVVEKLHGVEVADPYRWLEHADAAETKAWVEQQNAYTRSVLDKLPGREKIRERLNALLDIGVIGTPVPRKGKYFYTKREGKQNQPVLYVRDGLDGRDRVLIDVAALAADGTTALDWWFPSRDGGLVAYGLSRHGSEQSTLQVRDVATGKDLPDTIARTRACSVAWLPDGKGFYYTRYPAEGAVPKGEETYHRHVFFHALGTDPAKDPKVFGEGRVKEDWPSVQLSPDGRWLVVTEQKGWSMTEVYFKDLRDANASFLPLFENRKAIFDVIARNDRFYVHTNEGAPRYKLLAADPERLKALASAKAANRARVADAWEDLIPEGKDVLDNVGVIGDTIVAQYMQRASARLTLLDLHGKPVHEVRLPTLGSVAGLGGEWDGRELLFGFQSFTIAPGVYRIDLSSRDDPDAKLWQQVQTDLDSSAYEVSQVQYPSKDGTVVTMFLAHKKGLKRDGKNPTLLYGYGGFNQNLTPVFSASRFLFLEGGGLLAIPNLRGGGEYGEDWHQAGMLGKKQNVFDDFLAAAEWLSREKYTDRDHLVIQGGSNGGLLVGAALTQRPDLVKAVVCQVPLLDMVRYHKFLIARLWIPEYGSADDPEEFKWLHAYSPYHRVKDGTPYPATFILTAETDTRVDALHARKMTARLQAATSSEAPILLRLDTKAGHGAGKPRSKTLDELTDAWSFVLWQLGMKR